MFSELKLKLTMTFIHSTYLQSLLIWGKKKTSTTAEETCKLPVPINEEFIGNYK